MPAVHSERDLPSATMLHGILGEIGGSGADRDTTRARHAALAAGRADIGLARNTGLATPTHSPGRTIVRPSVCQEPLPFPPNLTRMPGGAARVLEITNWRFASVRSGYVVCALS